MKNPELDQLVKTSDPVLIRQALAVLYTRVSSGLELGEQRPSDLGMRSPSDAWNKANEYLVGVAHRDSKEGFKLAMVLVGIPHDDNVDQERKNQWMRTSGLMLLGLDQLKEELVSFLSDGPESKKLAGALKKYIKTDVSDLTTSRDFDGNPTGYSTVQAVYVGLGLKDGNNALSRELYSIAAKRASDPDLKTAYGILSSFTDCTYLKTRFESAIA